MSQQPFSRPGAVDLSGLSGAAPGAAPAAGAPGGSSYSVQLDEQSFQTTLEASMTAPVRVTASQRRLVPRTGMTGMP